MSVDRIAIGDMVRQLLRHIAIPFGIIALLIAPAVLLYIALQRFWRRKNLPTD